MGTRTILPFSTVQVRFYRIPPRYLPAVLPRYTGALPVLLLGEGRRAGLRPGTSYLYLGTGISTRSGTSRPLVLLLHGNFPPMRASLTTAGRSFASTPSVR